MIAPLFKTAVLCCLALGLVQSASVFAQGQVALTFDDLPVHGPLPRGLTRTQIMTQIVNALDHAGASEVYGFVNAEGVSGVEDSQQALRVWRSAGLALANHSYSHMDLHAHEPSAFQENVLANEPLLAELMRQEDWHWFRYPYLREGDTREKRHAVRSFLIERKYKIAQVTLDFHDYAYNAPYTRCLEKGDIAGILTLKSIYLREAAESLAASEAASKRLYGRNIKHVMLLHVGAFQPMMLPYLFSLLEEHGYELISLEAAHRDAVYEEDPDVTLEYGTSFLNQIALKRKLPTIIPYDAETISGLDSICR